MGTSWAEVAEKVSRIGCWEFEDCKPWPNSPSASEGAEDAGDQRLGDKATVLTKQA